MKPIEAIIKDEQREVVVNPWNRKQLAGPREQVEK